MLLDNLWHSGCGLVSWVQFVDIAQMLAWFSVDIQQLWSVHNLLLVTRVFTNSIWCLCLVQHSSAITREELYTCTNIYLGGVATYSVYVTTPMKVQVQYGAERHMHGVIPRYSMPVHKWEQERRDADTSHWHMLMIERNLNCSYRRWQSELTG